MSITTKNEQERIAKIRHERQNECDHSFNGDNVCEYCGLPEDDYGLSYADGNPIGTYA